MTDRKTNRLLLHHFLHRLSKIDVIDHFISVLSALYKDDNRFDEMTRFVGVYVNGFEIIHRNESLLDYQEPYRKKLFIQLINTLRLSPVKQLVLTDKIITSLYTDFLSSKLPFIDWWYSTQIPTIQAFRQENISGN